MLLFWLLFLWLWLCDVVIMVLFLPCYRCVRVDIWCYTVHVDIVVTAAVAVVIVVVFAVIAVAFNTVVAVVVLYCFHSAPCVASSSCSLNSHLDVA